jgi:Uma2 family endonuclease
MSISTRPMTADEFLVYPSEPGTRQELIRGEVRSMALPGGQHGDVALEAGMRLRMHAKANDLGRVYAAETGFLIERNPDTVNGADVAFVRRERLALITQPEKHVPFAPDLAVEVASPSDRPREIDEKTARWLAAGTLMVWNLYPKSITATVHRPGVEPVTLEADDEIDGGDLLPGFRCRVGDLFT